jgi:LPPG:FO 2-phospho-L-lactate transferase
MKITVLAGGFGGAKLSHGLALWAGAGDEVELAIVVNTADDLELHGLHISPDLDTVMYTLAGLANEETGWGVRGETWSAAEMLERYGAPTWFRLGDRDLATSILRTQRLRGGDRLTGVTARLAGALGVRARLLPMSDDSVRTLVRTDDGWLEFQRYFVERHHEDEVRELRYDGVDAARPTPEALDALGSAQLIILAPSNPFLSIEPILQLDGIEEALRAARAPVVAVSPIVGGKALRGPADRLFVSLGGEASALGVARRYAEKHPRLLDGLVIDTLDADQAPAIEALDIEVLVTDAVMRSDEDRARLAAEVVDFGRSLASRIPRPDDGPARARS